ncbi:MAG: M23 family metallopeptidase [Salinispira sp.]
MNMFLYPPFRSSAVFFSFMLFLALCCSLPLDAQSQNQSQSDNVRLYTEQDADEIITFYADNDHVIPAYLYVEFAELQNMTPSTAVPFGILLESNTRRYPLFSLSIDDKTQRVAYSYRYRHSLGNPDTAAPDENYLYTLPYAHGTKQQVTQGFHGTFTHSGENSYAVDFDLPTGTGVHAARSGIVVSVKEDSNSGGRGSRYAQYGNVISIMHSDGTFGNYVHLQRNGAIVEPGETVQNGQLIGYSGNTGQSSGPHLHFDVRIPQVNGKMQSIPIRFRGLNDEVITPEENHYYYSSHEKGAPFAVSYGADISNSDYINYSAPAQKQNTMDIRSEHIDSTFVLFIGNGFTFGIEAVVDLRLVSMNSSVIAPITIELNAGEERFLTILRPEPDALRSFFRSSITYRKR